MMLPENTGVEALIEEELTAFRDALKSDVAARSRTTVAKEK